MTKCERCNSTNVTIEKQLGGKVTCLECGHVGRLGRERTPFKPGQAVMYRPTDSKGKVYKEEPGIVKRMGYDNTSAFVWYHSGCTAANTPIKYLQESTITKEHTKIHHGCEECITGDPEVIMEYLVGSTEEDNVYLVIHKGIHALNEMMITLDEIGAEPTTLGSPEVREAIRPYIEMIREELAKVPGAEHLLINKKVMINKLEDLLDNSESFITEDADDDDVWKDDIEIIPTIIEAVKKYVPENIIVPRIKKELTKE